MDVYTAKAVRLSWICVCGVFVGCGCVSCMCRKVISMCAECGYVLCMRVALCDE